MMETQLVTANDASRELALRYAARTSFIDFVKYTYPSYIAEPFSYYCAKALEKVAKREITRLIISAPPRHGKTELVSVRFPAWYLPQYPRHNVILASYGADLAGAKAKECRDLIETEEHHILFPEVRVKDDSRAGNHWKLEYYESELQKWKVGGEFFSAGVGGPATGFGADVLIIDDYIKNWEEAQSITVKDKHWDWWRSTARTRLAPNAAVIIMATRWADDDLVGRIIQDKSEDWHIIRLPALAETQKERDFKNKKFGLPVGMPDLLGRKTGEALCPKRYTADDLKVTRKSSGSVIFEALYQGYPALAEGNRYKREWFRFKIPLDSIFNLTKGVMRVRYWDKAATDNGGCYTAGVLLTYVYGLKKFIIEDLVRVQHSTTEREKLIQSIAEQDARNYNNSVDIWIEQEPGSGGKDSAQITVDNLAGHKIYAEKVSGSKDVRLEQFAAQLEFGNVWLVNADWNDDLIEEFIAIPNSPYRDISDACGGAFNKIMLKRGRKAATSSPIITPVRKR